MAEQSKLDFLHSLRKQPYMQVRDGLTRLRAGSNKAHFRGVFEQKGVDTWIAVDAMRHALTGVADEIHIYTSDADLYPVFESLQDTKCRGVLFYQEGRTSAELIHSADRSEPIQISRILSYTSFANHYTSAQIAIPLDWNVLGTLEANEKELQLVRDQDQFGANLKADGSFVTSVRSRSEYLISDWAKSFGFDVPYSKIKEIYGAKEPSSGVRL